MSDATREMPRYRCHKEVWAFKIKKIVHAPADNPCNYSDDHWMIVPEEEGYLPVAVSQSEYMAKHNPQVGGYYVVYADGYASYSPAKPFEDGYTRVEAGPA